ncbi:MAG TPA: YicC/YloC family endoribonuclease [Gemmatimonadales bacterium]|nr:YicC/YloC family endoribonuclease [Gemmatimonadales bacterium]
MPYSMTGFGAADGPVAGGRLRVEIRTVNHRHFNPSLKLAADLSALEGDLRERLRKDFDRGHISVTVHWIEAPGSRGAGFTVNLERARAAATALSELQRALGVPGQVDLGMIVRQPEVITAGAEAAQQVAWSDVEPVVNAAIAECKAMRRREGDMLVEELGNRLELLEAAAKVIAARAPERLVRERDRLRRSVSELLDGRAPDEQRLAQEIALLADKLDITEELVRFTGHIAACREALAGDQPAGKRLGFLAQELGREVNTMGSKGNDAEILQQVIGMKGELEKFREQLENLE